jgi:4-amino-4-deoxy-L-arabinose transferase-like glycosyltransferase
MRTDTTHTSSSHAASRGLWQHPWPFILTVFAVLLGVSWQRWSSVIADSGREMDLPLRIQQGEWLYRDIHYLYPPLAPYLNALLYGILGAHLHTLYACGIAGALGVIFLTYKIARHLLPVDLATLATLAVVVLCVFKPTGSLIAPYTFAALYGLLLALGTVLCVLRWQGRPARRELVVVGLLIGLAALTKQEFALAAAVTVTTGLWLQHGKQFKLLIIDLLWAALPALALSLPVYGFILARVGWHTLIEDCHLLYTNLPASLVHYNAQRMGLNQPLASVLQMLGGAGVAALCVCALIALSVWRTQMRATTALRQKLGLTAVLSLAAIVIAQLTANGRWDGSPLRALPLLLIALWFVHWRQRQDNAKLLILCVASLILLARVVLRVPSGGAFGSFFLPTSIIVICYALCVMLPQAIERWTNNAAAGLYARRAGMTLLGVLLFVSAIVFGIRFRRNFSYPISTARGTLYTTRAIGPAYQEALTFLASNAQPDEPIAVLPEGSDLAFLSGHPMALRMQIALPGFLDTAGEQAELTRLAQRGVRYVLVVNRPMREFGAEAFGRDFFPLMGAQLASDYSVVHVCGVPNEPNIAIGDKRFFIKILTRNKQ